MDGVAVRRPARVLRLRLRGPGDEGEHRRAGRSGQRTGGTPQRPGETATPSVDTRLLWQANTEPDLAGYEVVCGETTAPDWTHRITVGNVTTSPRGSTKDNFLFGVRAVDATATAARSRSRRRNVAQAGRSPCSAGAPSSDACLQCLHGAGRYRGPRRPDEVGRDRARPAFVRGAGVEGRVHVALGRRPGRAAEGADLELLATAAGMLGPTSTWPRSSGHTMPTSTPARPCARFAAVLGGHVQRPARELARATGWFGRAQRLLEQEDGDSADADTYWRWS